MSSDPLLPFAVWQSGTNENSIPANDNALRSQVIAQGALGFADSAPPSPSQFDLYIVGTPWSVFSTNEAVIYLSGTWYGFAPFEGWAKTIAGALYIFDGTDWNQVIGNPDRNTVTAVTSAAGVVTLDCSQGDYFTLALTENVTSWVISNPPGSGKGFTLMVQLTQDTTARTVAKPGTTAGGLALDVSTGSGAVDVLAITSFDNGTTLRSTIAKAFS